MKYFLILFFPSVLYLISNEIVVGAPRDKNSLELVYVLFRHGNRTPNGPEELYPKDPYKNEKYLLTGLGQLTQAGKEREYQIGKALRARYNDFLGPYYSSELIEPLSTDYNRTKMSLLLALAGLFPPRGKQEWKPNLEWQPIPYNYLPTSQDKVLLGSLCPHYLTLYEAYIKTPKVQAEFNKYKQIFQYISQNSGLNISTFEDIYNLFFGLRAEQDYGLKLPEWTKKVWPSMIKDLAVRQYYIYTGTKELIQMITGYFIQKVVDDISLLVNGVNKERKIYLASAHELNVATFLIALGAFQPAELPNYGAYVILEVHKRNGVYGLELYYQNYVTNQPVKLKIAQCHHFCPFKKFKELMQKYIPPSPDFCYQE